MSIRLLRLPEVLAMTGKGKSQTYVEIKGGTFPPGISCGLRCKRWHSGEVSAAIAARIAGKSDDEIRTLVRKLVAARRTAA